jgi:hypothetical protein
MNFGNSRRLEEQEQDGNIISADIFAKYEASGGDWERVLLNMTSKII